jgi:hypothetical protein
MKRVLPPLRERHGVRIDEHGREVIFFTIVSPDRRKDFFEKNGRVGGAGENQCYFWLTAEGFVCPTFPFGNDHGGVFRGGIAARRTAEPETTDYGERPTITHSPETQRESISSGVVPRSTEDGTENQ